MAFLFTQPTIIVPILLSVLIVLVFIGIVALFIRSMEKRRERMKESIEHMKKLNNGKYVLRVSKNYRETYK